MDQETIKKYCDRFETTPEAGIPNAVIFEAIAAGLKSKVHSEINRINLELLSALKYTHLTIEEPLPFNIAHAEGHSKVYYKAIWEKMVDDAKTPEQAARYVLGLLEAALGSGVLKSTIGGYPDNFETPDRTEIEDHYRHTRKRYPQYGIKFTAKNKGTLQLHTGWR